MMPPPPRPWLATLVPVPWRKTDLCPRHGLPFGINLDGPNGQMIRSCPNCTTELTDKCIGLDVVDPVG